MQHSFKLILLCSVILAACTANDKKQGTDLKSVQDDTTQRSISKYDVLLLTDTLTIDISAAVFFSPDSLQIEKRMKEAGEANFRAGAGDYIYYMNTSAEYLEKQGLKVLDAKNRKFLKFVSGDKKVQLIKLDSLPELWGVYLFDTNKKPYRADMTLVEEEFKKYYK